MSVATLHENIGRWLAHPKQFSPEQCSDEIATHTKPMSISDLDLLGDFIENIERDILVDLQILSIFDDGQRARVDLNGLVERDRALGANPSTEGSDPLLKSELVNRILKVSHIFFGRRESSRLVFVGYFASIILENRTRELEIYKREAKSVAVRIRKIIKKEQLNREIAFAKTLHPTEASKRLALLASGTSCYPQDTPSLI